MYFILSKVLLFIIIPIYWIIILLLIAAFTKHRKLRKRSAIAAVILLAIFSNEYLCNSLSKAWEWPQVHLPDTAHYSCSIVLGGFSSQNSGKEGHFNYAADRFIQAVELQATGKTSHILISGGNGTLNPDVYSEGEWARGQLKKFNFPDSVILIESKSRNTLENAQFSAALLKKSGLKPPYLLITSAFHMRRALMIFKNAGVDVRPYPGNFMAADMKFAPNQLIPDFEALTWWDLYIKEICGYAVNYFMGK